ncbi:MAG: hypothetical protein JRJ49_08255 [Deltaproteobacteria bacterium]|nr:hypothetical protein [Deltaproteobacteria bacterium]
MSKLKTIFWCLLIAAIAIMVYQNEAFFMAQQVITFKLFSLTYNTPYIPCGIFIIIFVLSAFLIVYINHLIFRIKTNKIVKKLKSQINNQNTESEFKSAVSEKSNI